MLYVSDKYTEAISSDHRNMPYRITLAGALVFDQTRVTTMTLDESVGGGTSVALGTANSSVLKFTLKDAEPIDYDGMLVEAESGLELPDGTVEYVPLGRFWVTEFSTSDDYKTVNFTCADGMYHMTSEYESELTYPTSIKSVVEEIISKSGIEFEEPLEWPDITVRCKPKTMTFRDAIGCVAGCFGCVARFNRSGKLEFVWYTDHGVVIPRELQYMNGMTKLNFKPIEVNFEVIGQKETYTVNVISDGSGGVRADPGKNLYEGDTVVISVNPFNGYKLATISAATEDGTAVTLYKNAEDGYTFIQPDSNVTVTVSFRSTESTNLKLTTRTNGNGVIRSNKTEYTAGETASIYILPDDGYELDNFDTIPTTIELKFVGTTSLGEMMYEFTMPQSDVVVTANYREIPVFYSITAYVDESEFSPGYLYVKDATTGEFPLRTALPGTHVVVTLAPHSGYSFDHFESSVELIQMDALVYRFVMPEENVSIVAHFKYYEDETKAGLYSWLQSPVSPPTAKKNWAVFYRDDATTPVWKKFYLVWFDSWAATSYETVAGRRLYNLQIDGYYYCKSQNTGYAPHAWDVSSWSGNGTSGTTLNWKVDVLGQPWSRDNKRSYADYCLLASNVPLIRNDQFLFEKCERAIQAPQTSYIVDGMDVREKGSLTYWKCPDTFSTPAPASNWMIVDAYGSLAMTPENDRYYDADFCDGLYIVFFDSISVENIGAVFSNTDEEFYIARVTNGHYCSLQAKTSTSSWDLYDIEDGDVLGLRSSLISARGASDYLGSYHFSGILASSIDIGTLIKANSCRVCECETETYTPTVLRSYSPRRNSSDAIVVESGDIYVTTENDKIKISGSIAATGKKDCLYITIGSAPVVEAEKITINYSNPFIYEKMVADVSENVKSITYTPSMVKHRGNPAIQAGDIVSVLDKDGVKHIVLVMQQTMSFGGGMNAQITCPGETNKTKTFNSSSYVSNLIDEKVEQSSFDLERRIATNNSLVYASLYKSISSTEAKIASVVEWQTEKNATIARIEQTATATNAKIALVVGQNGIVNDDGAVQGSIVVQAINGQSKAKISADRLDIEGKTLNIKVASTNITGKLTAEQINTDNIEVKKGTIGGWEIDSDMIGYGAGSSTSCFFLSRKGARRWLDAANAYVDCVLDLGGNFGVDTTGKMYANGAVIKGNVTVTGGIIGGFSADSNKLEKVSTTTSGSAKYDEITTIEPGRVITDYTRSLDDSPVLRRATMLSSGMLHFTLSGSELETGPKTLFTVMIHGTTYTVKIDTDKKTFVIA